MSKMVEMVIDSVKVSLTNQQRMVILREENADRYLPIWIGPYEAEAITIALQEIEVSRPQTHDLLKNVIGALGSRLVRVEILALRDDVYYGNLVVESNGRLINIDSRPSDALALAVRTRVPIFAAREVLDVAGVVPEEDLQGQKPAPIVPSAEAGPEPGEERLSVFEDFLDKLDLDTLGKSEDEGDDEPDEGKPKGGRK